MDRNRALLVAAAMGIAAALPAVPAGAIGFGIGIGSRIPNTGISVGVGYRRDRYGRGVDTSVYVDAGYYARRRAPRREDRERERERGRDRDDGREAPLGGANVRLRVAPASAWVFLNGVLVDAYGDDGLDLPAGRHRLEFARAGHRTEVAELDVQPGIAYRVERKLARLERREAGDPRVERDAARPVSVREALRRTEELWSRPAGPAREPRDDAGPEPGRLDRERGGESGPPR